jgi:hypothetical protein
MKKVLKSFVWMLLAGIPACSGPVPATGETERVEHAAESSEPPEAPPSTQDVITADVADVSAETEPAPHVGSLVSHSLAGGRWVPIAAEGAPSAREGAGAVFVGDELVIWGGDDPQREAQFGVHSRPSRRPLPGGVYNTRTRTWRSMSTEGQAAAGRTRIESPILLALSDRRVVVCVHVGDCRLYDLAADTWTRMARFPVGHPNCVVTAGGSELLCLGVQGSGRASAYVAYRYDFAVGSWSPIGSAFSFPIGYSPKPSDTGATLLTGFGANGLRVMSIELPSQAFPEGRIVDRGIEVFGARVTRALDVVRPLSTGSVFYLFDSFDQVCERAGEPHCRRPFDVRYFNGGRERCQHVETPGPASVGVFAVRRQSDDCQPLPEQDGFFCYGGRVMYHRLSDRMLAFETHGFGCVVQGEDLYCWAATAEGQPSLRWVSAQAYDSGRVAIWGGRATQIEEPVRDLRRGNCMLVGSPNTMPGDPDFNRLSYCGMRRNGTLLNDGAIYEVGRGPRIQTSPCPPPPPEVNGGDDDDWDGDDDELEGLDLEME